MSYPPTTETLRGAVRAGGSQLETDQLERLRTYATLAIDRYLGTASVNPAVKLEAMIRLVAYLYDQPTVSGGTRFSAAFRNSGAAVMLAPYRVHRAVAVGAS